MAHDTLTCELRISGETLSAWRDAQLPPAEMARIRAHAATCPACQARLAGFDTVARALLRQREIEPDGRMLDSVRLRAARRPRRALRRWPRGRVWSGLGALASVAAILLLFVYVLGFGRGHPTGPLGGKTPTASQNPAPTTTLSPAPTTTSTYSAVVDIPTAWGDHAASVTLEAGDNSHVMGVTNTTADGHDLLGYELTLTSNGNLDPNVPARAGYMDVTTKHFTPIGVSDPANYPPGCCLTDGRFLIASEDTQPGATCGLCHRAYWSYDLTTGQLYRVALGTDFQMINNIFLSQGVLMMATGQGIMVAHLAARTITPLSGIPSTVSISALSWPYLIYSVYPPSQENPSSAPQTRVRDLATGQDRALPQVDALFASSPGSSGGIVVTGDTLFITVDEPPPSSPDGAPGGPTTLYELDTLMNAGAQPRIIGVYGGDLGAPLGANARIVLFRGFAWDRAEIRFVNLGSADVSLSGAYLARSLHGDSPVRIVGPVVSIYNTATLLGDNGA